MSYFKIIMDNDKNIWIIGYRKIVRFDGNYFHIYNLIDNFGFEYINPNTAVIDTKGNIWFGTKNQILKFDGSKLTCFNNVYDVELKKQKYDPRSYDYYAEIDKIFVMKMKFFSVLKEKSNYQYFKIFK